MQYDVQHTLSLMCHWQGGHFVFGRTPVAKVTTTTITARNPLRAALHDRLDKDPQNKLKSSLLDQYSCIITATIDCLTHDQSQLRRCSSLASRPSCSQSYLISGGSSPCNPWLKLWIQTSLVRCMHNVVPCFVVSHQFLLTWS